MRPSRLLSLLSLSLLGLLQACSSASGEPTASQPAAGACTVGATACDGLDVKRCELQSAVATWSAKTSCDEGQACRAGACAPYTDEETARLQAIDVLLAESRDRGATASPVDYAALQRSLHEKLLLGDGSPKAYVSTLWSGMLALPQGHQHLGPKDAQDYPPYESAGFSLGSLTRYSACLRPYQDHAVVTIADAKAALKRGDEIVAIDGKRGEGLKALLVSQPLGFDFLPPTEAGRMAFALRSFFSVDRTGTVLTVRRGGAELDVTLPAPVKPESGYGCDDAFGRDYTKPAIGTVLADGTGVLYISGFAQTSVEAFEKDVGPEFDKVKDAPRLVIDLRGNGGGLLRSALDVVSQIPDARRTDYCEFFERTSGSSPATYVSRSVRSVDPATVPAPARFPYRGRVAVLIDGATHSAAEHFALATKLATNAILVGTKTAGAYGTITSDKTLALPGSPALEVSINRSQVRSLDGKPLDGTSVEPHVVVEYEPEAMAKSQDPMLQRAILELSK